MKDTTRAGIMRFVEHGIKPGDFLTAVLENDLMEAMGRADEENRRDIFEICQFIHMDIPARCHGSPQQVYDWMKERREEKEKS